MVYRYEDHKEYVLRDAGQCGHQPTTAMLGLSLNDHEIELCPLCARNLSERIRDELAERERIKESKP